LQKAQFSIGNINVDSSTSRKFLLLKSLLK